MHSITTLDVRHEKKNDNKNHRNLQNVYKSIFGNCINAYTVRHAVRILYDLYLYSSSVVVTTAAVVAGARHL